MPGSVNQPRFRIFSASVLDGLSDAAKRQHANRVIDRYRNDIQRVVINTELELRRDARNGRIDARTAATRIARLRTTANRLILSFWTQVTRYLDIRVIRPTRF